MLSPEGTKIAANGFSVSVRLLSYSLKCTEREALERIAAYFERDAIQFEHYLKIGLQPRLIDRYVAFLRSYDVVFAKHQLRPTKEILAIHKWSEENER
ncbi:hypothetical protein AB4306_18450 [Vibrio splendidus]|uniref:hypothetical protein n=1 Tax=Vibrio splendidus TaxID=29497 RepID=UPI000769CE8E|nr:hypothetical protein [Vibrio splendidus]PHX05476.1 hypothetical protein VSPL_28700 [Vibrio splendidus]